MPISGSMILGHRSQIPTIVQAHYHRDEETCYQPVHKCYAVSSNAFGSVVVRPSEVVTCTSKLPGRRVGGRVT
jgi:hypothetical protein